MGIRVEGEIVEVDVATRQQLTLDAPRTDVHVDSDEAVQVSDICHSSGNEEELCSAAEAVVDGGYNCRLSTTNQMFQCKRFLNKDRQYRYQNFKENKCQSTICSEEIDNLSLSQKMGEVNIQKSESVFNPKDSVSLREAHFPTCSLSVAALPDIPTVTRVNLDVSTLICITSNVCNGHCNFIFKDNILRLQAEEERKKPLLPTLTEFLRGEASYFKCNQAIQVLCSRGMPGLEY